MSTLETMFREACSQLRSTMGPKADLVALEERIRSELDAIGRELMREAYAAADVDTPTVMINRVLHSRVRRFGATLHTTFGAIDVEKTTYQPNRKTKPVCATDLVLGIVEDFYTPKCAKILCLLTALAVREEVEAIVGAFGGMSMGSATMYRIPQAVIARYEKRVPRVHRQEMTASSKTPKKPARGPGTFVIIPLGDGTFGYGRLIDKPNIAFYRYRTDEPETDLDKIAANPIAFTIAVRNSAADQWKAVGRRELEEPLRKPIVRFNQDAADFRQCTIYDNANNVRSATPDECEGLERSAVWEASGVQQRLLDMFAGRPNEDVERMKVRRS